MENNRTLHRLERRELKQKLFHIRRFVEGEQVKLLTEHQALKKQYESHPDFTQWSDFPEKWDIGDPHKVKSGAWGNEVDQRNFKKAFSKKLTDIIKKDVINEE